MEKPALSDIRNKSILVTGAGRGIGKRLALGLAQAGVRVGLLARSQAELDLAKLEIEQAGGNALRLRADVRDLEQMMSAVDRMKVVFGGIDGLVAAAGVLGPIGPLISTRPKAWAETLDINLLGVVNSVRAVLPTLVEKRSGKIVVIVCGGAGHPRPNFAVYAATKAAVTRFVECVAEEVGGDNVQINCVAPGRSYTHMTDEILRAGEEKAGAQEIAAARQVRIDGGTPAEKQIALVSFLASPRSNHISGKLVESTDDWKRFEKENMRPELFTLRRVQRL
jgi:NAD(P)-dependent dehydrogenase (short-subunit alcohol dehydrogenase family)